MRLASAAGTSAALALLIPTTIAAHAGLSPAGLPVEVDTRFAVAVPNERKGHVTTRVELTLPRGISLVRAEPESGWTSKAGRQQVSWTGGRIEGRRSVTFDVVLVADGPPGSRVLSLKQGYEDGKSVDTETSLTVLPAAVAVTGDPPRDPPQHLGRALVAAAVGLVLVSGSLLVLRRRRPGREA